MSQVLIREVFPVAAGAYETAGEASAAIKRKLKQLGVDSGVQIREKKNLLGISYDVDETDVVTRIMPTGEDADGNILYLPELYIDSPNIGAYTHPKWIHLAVSEAREVTDGDTPKSKDQCYAELRKAAQTEYENGCDLPTVTLKVDFINCAETEEYRDYKPLQDIFLGDSVRVIAPRIGVEVSMRMTQYTYDCLQRRYTAMTLGSVADTLESEGWLCWQGNLSGLPEGRGSGTVYSELLRALEARENTARITLADSATSAAVLGRLLTALREDRYDYRVAVETEF